MNGSAAGSVLNDQFGIPSLVGVGILFAASSPSNYFGRDPLQRVHVDMHGGAYAVLIIYSVMTFIRFTTR